MNKALFYRKCSSLGEYKTLSSKYSDLGQKLYFKIVKTILLPEKEYYYFINNFLKDFSFIADNKNIATMNHNDVVSCLLITSNKKDGILVYPSGYSYARYVAFWINSN